MLADLEIAQIEFVDTAAIQGINFAFRVEVVADVLAVEFQLYQNTRAKYSPTSIDTNTATCVLAG